MEDTELSGKERKDALFEGKIMEIPSVSVCVHCSVNLIVLLPNNYRTTVFKQLFNVLSSAIITDAEKIAKTAV